MGMVILGRCFSHSVRCNRTRTSGGRTMMGVAFNTRLRAVSPTASFAAVLLLPKDFVSNSPASILRFSSSVWTGYTSIPFRISSPRIRNTFNAPALATAAKGTSRPRVNRAEGESDFSRGTSAFRPSATPHEALTARKYDLTMAEVDSGVDLFALALLIATFSD